nr:class B sortase [uncultured Mediterraneibacter sp.]
MNSVRKGPSGRRTGRMILRAINSAADTVMLLIFLLLLAFGIYAVWDARIVQQEAAGEQFRQYRPAAEDAGTFEEFRQINPEVFGWLTVYGTNIDYPLVQAEDNEKYLNTSADGEYSLSGSLFLDFRNRNDLSDFNSIIYGHHMAGNVMFGDIGSFKDREYFESRMYGELYCDGQYYGLEFFAFLEVDAYNDAVYHPAVTGEAQQRDYLNMLREQALYYREIGVDYEDRVVLLSTCTSDITNGRHILAGRLTDTVKEDPFQEEAARGEGLLAEISLTSLLPVICAVGVTVFLALVIIFLNRRRGK